MGSLSRAIFEWDSEDVELLLQAKKNELQMAGVKNPSAVKKKRSLKKNLLSIAEERLEELKRPPRIWTNSYGR